MKSTTSLPAAPDVRQKKATGTSTPGDDNFSQTVNHYVPKRQITESIVMGTKVTALCGVRYVIKAQGGGSAAATSAIVCPLCADVYYGMPAGRGA